MIPAELSELIRGWIEKAKRDDPTSLTRGGDALLIYRDMGGSCFIRPDGTVLTEGHDSDGGPQVEVNEGWRCVALLAGSRGWPELACLLPPRPSDAVVCRNCSGTGSILIGKVGIGCGSCCGLGWCSPTVTIRL
jgi:hypothetical protein